MERFIQATYLGMNNAIPKSERVNLATGFLTSDMTQNRKSEQRVRVHRNCHLGVIYPAVELLFPGYIPICMTELRTHPDDPRMVI
ncbi:hypothetical protein IAQ61_008108 [Plenodomus lingam]|uniref:uncharacterized protein n=1 Tax=Leptosphaeria maculans TaxID=5022 RepID=UPI0033195568|nr:hypothetical protein IAQ61_008108 [Plenodomus lingam]